MQRADAARVRKTKVPCSQTKLGVGKTVSIFQSRRICLANHELSSSSPLSHQLPRHKPRHWDKPPNNAGDDMVFLFEAVGRLFSQRNRCTPSNEN